MPTRILLWLSLLAGLLAPLCALALGVGPIEVRSALNQNFEADIPLIVSNPAELTSLAVQIPRQQEFDRTGVERLELLSKLKFTVQSPPGGRGPNTVKVTSTEPIREPNFNFLLELTWPRGRLIREFTVQLDPELYTNRRQPAPRVVAPPPAIAPPVAAAPPPPPAAPSLPPAPPVSFEGALPYGPVKSGETLAAIADRLRPGSSFSRPQMMAILLAGNPQAFTNGNPSTLRAGTTLKVPTPQALGVQGAPAAPPTPVEPAPTTAPPPEPTVSPAAPVTVAAAPPVAPEPVAPAAAPVAPPAPPPVTPAARIPEVAPPAPLPAPETPVATGPATTPPRPAPVEQPQEITPQAITPQPEPQPPPPPVATTPTPQPSSAAPLVEKPATPPPAAKPPVPQPAESELSWLDNPVVWVAIALIVLAIASIILLPLLRRPARPKAAAAESALAPASAATTPEVDATTTRLAPHEREPRSIRPASALATALPARAQPVPTATATAPPKPIDEMLRNIDFGTGDEVGVGTAEQRSRPLPDAEPPTASITRRTEDEFLAEPATGSPPTGTPIELTKTKAPAPAEPASELRFDEGLDFNLGDLSFETKAQSQAGELPPLELKPAQATPPPPTLTQRLAELPPLELHSVASPKPATPAQEPKQPAADLKFEFNEVSREQAARGGTRDDALRLDEDLKTLGLDTLNLGAMDTASLDSGLGGLGAGAGSSEAATDYVETKLDLASAYLDMGDQVGARSLLEDVIREGDASQKQRADALLKKLG